MPLKEHDRDRDDLRLTVRRQSLEDYARRPEAIGRGRDHWGRMGLAGRKEFDTHLLERARHPESIAYAIAPAQGAPVMAFINDNRWLARCECGGLAVVDPDEPEFYCHACFNMSNGGVPFGKDTHGGYPRPILFPGKRDIEAIEDVLLVSEDPLWRNWSALDEGGEQPGSAYSNRLPSPDELAISIERLRQGNEAVGLPRARDMKGR